MKTPKIIVALTAAPQTKASKDRRLGKKLYTTVGAIVAIATVCVALFFTQGTPAIAAQAEWSNTYFGTSGKAIQTSDGGYLIAGSNASLMFPAAERAPALTPKSGWIRKKSKPPMKSRFWGRPICHVNSKPPW